MYEEILQRMEAVTPDTAEAFYQDFYPACTGGELRLATAGKFIAELQRLIGASDEPVLRSYGLLYFGAVVDSGLLPKPKLAEIGAVLAALLRGLTDFRARDSAGQYLHFINHASFLALSLHEAGGKVPWEPLLEAYLRADSVFLENEDIVLAEGLLEMVPCGRFSEVLARLKGGKAGNAKASNQRALWMGMMALNIGSNRQEMSLFQNLLDEVGELVT